MAVPVARTPWWRRWLEPIMVVTIIALFTALVTGEVAVFQSVKDDVRAAETRTSERIGPTYLFQLWFRLDPL